MSAINYVKPRGDERILRRGIEHIDASYNYLPPNVYKGFMIGQMFSNDIPSYEAYKLGEKLVNFKSGIVSDIVKKCSDFFSTRVSQIYKNMEIAQKMGIIMYGPHGTGKTATAHLIMMNLVNEVGAICINATECNTSETYSLVKEVRKIQENPIILFIDECDNTLQNNENHWLNILDGDKSFDRFIFLGCTNNYNRIPKRIRNRKSRIKYSYEVRSLPFEVFKQYTLEKYPKVMPKELNELSYKAVENELTIDEFKHVLLDYLIEQDDIGSIIKRVKDYRDQSET